MAPLGFMAASVGLWAKSFSVFSCTSSLTRVLSATYNTTVRCLATQTDGPPKRPLNGYMRYFLQQHPIVTKQNPDIRAVDITRKIANQWRALSPDHKRPLVEAYKREKEQFNLDLQRYKAQLTPGQIQLEAQEKKERRAKRKAIRKKRELTNLGKPKRPRSAFNIFMSEHFVEARGATTQAKMKSLLDDWRSLFSNQKQVYTQLAEDDKIRYKNEMKSWEDHMADIGRADLIRHQTLATKKKKTPAESAKPKKTKAAKGAKASRKTTKKTVRTGKKSSDLFIR
ncbi:transcription factor A, mitochondrial [Synchiropus splendidus]|uniref:transcription factor A, mitochondrial n=1 Tax=Synchiropus splendidus TaxID=270530 RepID=UPI00237E5E01|nr:transcription factor A, mitochondrial [Synchiropus splendidus]